QDWDYTLTNVTPALYSDLEGQRITVADAAQEPAILTLGQDLQEEMITSREISHFGQFPMNAAIISLEVRGFKDEMRDMMSGIIPHIEWSLSNAVAIDQKGFDVEAMQEYPGIAVRASNGYLDQYARYSGAPIIDVSGSVDTKDQDCQTGLLTR